MIILPDKFIPSVSVIEETKDLSTLSIQSLMGSLKSYEQRVKGDPESSLESVFQSKVIINNRKTWSNDHGGNFLIGSSGYNSEISAHKFFTF